MQLGERHEFFKADRPIFGDAGGDFGFERSHF